MISREFKVFLLILLFFGSLWAYQFRGRDLRSWLELGEPPPEPGEDLVDLKSDVGWVLDPSKDQRFLTRISFLRPQPSMSSPETQFHADSSPAGIAWGEEDFSAPDIEEESDEEPVELMIRSSLEDADPSIPKSDDGEKKRGRENKESESPKGPSNTNRPPIPTDPHKDPADGNRNSAKKSNPTVVKTVPEKKPMRISVKHKVRKKETLASIARRYYKNNTGAWRKIFAANRGKLSSPHKLPVGLVLTIPGVEVTASSSKKEGVKTVSEDSTRSRSSQRNG